MKTQNLDAKTSGYRAPELHKLGTLDKVQGYCWGYWVDFYYYYYY